jgi:hypothetical protein
MLSLGRLPFYSITFTVRLKEKKSQHYQMVNVLLWLFLTYCIMEKYFSNTAISKIVKQLITYYSIKLSNLIHEFLLLVSFNTGKPLLVIDCKVLTLRIRTIFNRPGYSVQSLDYASTILFKFDYTFS